MDYRGKILRLDVKGNGHAMNYICTSQSENFIELVPANVGYEGVVYDLIPASAITIRDYWSNPNTIKEVRERIQKKIQEILSAGKDSAVLTGMYRNLERIDSLDGDDPVDLTPPVPKQECGVSIHPNYVGKIALIEFPLDSDVAHHSTEFIILAQSNDSLYGVKTDSAQMGVHVGRIPFTSGDQSIKILSVVEDDQFIRDFIERLDDMTTDDYPPELCDAAETTSRRLSRLLGEQFDFLIINEIYSHDPALHDLFN